MDKVSEFEKILFKKAEEQQKLIHNLALQVQEMATHYGHLLEQVKNHDVSIQDYKKWFWRLSGACMVIGFLWGAILYFLSLYL